MKTFCLVGDIRLHLTENTLPVHCNDRTKRTDGPNAVLRDTKAGGVCQCPLDCLQLCALLLCTVVRSVPLLLAVITGCRCTEPSVRLVPALLRHNIVRHCLHICL